MSAQHLVLMSLAVLVAAFVQGATGVGFALIAAPVIGLVRPELLPVCVLVLMLPLNLYVAWRERGAIDGTGARWITGGRVAGTAGGLWVLAALSAGQLSLFVGASTVAAALVTLLMPAFSPGRGAFVGAGLVTGITETATGIGGPPLALVYQHQPAPTMRSTIALCFLLGELVSLAVLLATSRVGLPQLQAAALLLPALVVGAVLSRLVHRRVNGRLLRIFVQVFAIVSGLVLLVKAF
ncbi:sulfite exporter TauE/SafE family protein [Variovorax sp. CY25R-8]|uniref:sulfite exporter TauE/SafE family protein n=1 Tax=Variovorax sp. CY25R-8 TaxID=2855501 RepID=UPI0021BB85B3|nr:sulfite exporter TauE/SafE family protein [Variovorax sp. CY25R-8]MCT8180188.1 sulfite exporter TauE/SafE family protein [Variovorax sp. CY25R-8]